MVSWRPKLVVFFISTKALNIWDFPTNATPQVGMHFESHWVHSLALSPTCESLILQNLFSWSHVLLHSTLNHEPNVRVTTNKVFWTKYLLKWNTTFCFLLLLLVLLIEMFSSLGNNNHNQLQ
jgi:hypothetical protein